MEQMQFRGYTLSYHQGTALSGMDFGQDFIPVVRKLFAHPRSVCDLGAGNGFIGLGLLASGLCDSLTLIDINPLAVEACRKTIEDNHLEDKVTAYHSDVFKSVPENVSWDLIVSNPPHRNGSESRYEADVNSCDPGWRIHRELYGTASKHLVDGGSILAVEDGRESSPAQWKEMVSGTDLTFVKAFKHKIIRFPGIKSVSYFKAVAKRSDTNIIRMGIKWLLHPIYPYYFVWSTKRAK